MKGLKKLRCDSHSFFLVNILKMLVFRIAQKCAIFNKVLQKYVRILGSRNLHHRDGGFLFFSSDISYAGEAASLEYNIFSMIGVKIEDTMIRKITDVKYTGVSSPAVRPFCATIRATSPRVIIPTPIFSESRPLNLQRRAISPQPIIFETSPTATNAMEKARIPILTLSTFVFNPMLAKKTGPNSM